MRMMDDWIRIKLVDTKVTGLSLPEGYEKNAQDDDTLFEVLETGPEVKNIKKSMIIVVSFMSGMYRFKLPQDSFKSFAVRENDVIGIVPPAPINAREASIIT